MLKSNWKQVVRKAWSIRFILLAGLFSGLEVVVPLFVDTFPRNVFAVLSGISTAGALIARVMMQRNLDD